jgi:maleylpyruvate isomerase
MTARQLAAAVDALTDEACARRVRTAQGRVVPATEIPWLRAREVCVHAVDLAGSGSASVSFPDLPAGFTAALVEDVTALRSSRGDGPALSLRATDAATTWTVRGAGRPRELTGTVSGLAAWLTGRGDDVHTADSEPLPALPRWL